MRHICRVMSVVSLTLMVCSPASAEHSGPYLGLIGGGNIIMKAKSTDSQGDFSFKFDPSYLMGAVVGWDLSRENSEAQGRVELEYSRRSNPLNEAGFVEGSIKGTGKVGSDSCLMNLYAVYRDQSILSPYIGVGAGAAFVKASDLAVAGNAVGHGSSTVFAYQFGTGAELALSRRVSLDLGYRFFGTIKPKFTESNGDKFRMEYFNHSAVLGVKYGF